MRGDMLHWFSLAPLRLYLAVHLWTTVVTCVRLGLGLLQGTTSNQATVQWPLQNRLLSPHTTMDVP